jgi:hypothetical protein
VRRGSAEFGSATIVKGRAGGRDTTSSYFGTPIHNALANMPVFTSGTFKYASGNVREVSLPGFTINAIVSALDVVLHPKQRNS